MIYLIIRKYKDLQFYLKLPICKTWWIVKTLRTWFSHKFYLITAVIKEKVILSMVRLRLLKYLQDQQGLSITTWKVVYIAILNHLSNRNSSKITQKQADLRTTKWQWIKNLSMTNTLRNFKRWTIIIMQTSKRIIHLIQKREVPQKVNKKMIKTKNSYLAKKYFSQKGVVQIK